MDIASLKKQSIVFTTIDLINEFGFHGVTTREVARRQGISQGTVFQYFPKKADLISAVLDHYSLYDIDLFQSTKIRKLNPDDAILFYIDTYTAYMENYPAITALDQAYDVLINDPELGVKVKNIFKNRSIFMRDLIIKAQLSGNIKEDVDCDTAADIITSTQRGLCLKWRIEGYSFSLREKTLQAVNMLMRVFCS